MELPEFLYRHKDGSIWTSGRDGEDVTMEWRAYIAELTNPLLKLVRQLDLTIGYKTREQDVLLRDIVKIMKDIEI